MFKFIALAIALFAAAASAQSACCSPDVWSGDAMGFNSEQRFAFFEKLYYDANSQKVRADLFGDHHGKNLTATVWMDYSTKTEYIKANGNKCFTKPLKGDFEKACVPSGYKETFSYTVGGSLDVWGFAYEQADGGAFFNVAANGCIPIDGAMFKRHKSVDRVSYVNVVPSVPSGILTPPSDCSPAPM